MLDAQLLSAKTGEGMGPAVKVGLPTTYYSTTLLRYYSTTLLLTTSSSGLNIHVHPNPNPNPNPDQAVMQQRNGRDVYVMGAANVGKSLFIGALLDLLHAEQGGRMSRLPISSATPGAATHPSRPSRPTHPSHQP